MRRWAGRVLAMLAVVAPLAACGEPEFQYPRDTTEGVYFKVPQDWTVFDETEENLEGRLEAGASIRAVRSWIIDAHDSAAVTNADVFDGDRPVGTASIYETTPRVGQSVSISAVRAAGFEFDPVSPPAELDTTFEVALDQPLRTEDGVSGAVVIFNRRASVTDEWLSYAREVFVDPSRRRIYVLDLYCSATCFEEHSDDIFDILDSWRIDL